MGLANGCSTLAAGSATAVDVAVDPSVNIAVNLRIYSRRTSKFRKEGDSCGGKDDSMPKGIKDLRGEVSKITNLYLCHFNTYSRHLYFLTQTPSLVYCHGGQTSLLHHNILI